MVRAFLRGTGTNLLNPKVGAFYIAIFPQFMPAHVSHLAMGLGLAGVGQDLRGDGVVHRADLQRAPGPGVVPRSGG